MYHACPRRILSAHLRKHSGESNRHRAGADGVEDLLAETGNNELTNKSLLMVIKSKKITSRHKGWMVTEGGACLVKVSKERVFLRGSDIYAIIH